MGKLKNIKVIISLLVVILICIGLLFGYSKMKESTTSTGKVLNVYNWGDYIDPTLITQFEQETGIKVNYNTYDTNETMYAKIKSGSSDYDIVVPSDYMIEKMIKENLLEKIDFSKIPNYKYIGSQFKHLSYDPTDEYSVPYMWGTIGIAYNSKYIKGPITSWKDLWNPKYKDQIVMFDSVRDSMAIALKSLGYSMNSTNPEQIKEAGALLREQKPLVLAYFVDEVKDALLSGEATIAPVWSGDAAYMMSEDPDIKYVIPKEGSNEWFDALAIPKNAPHKEAAEEFINFLCNPENGLKNVEYIGYQTPIPKTFDMLPEDIKKEYPTKEQLKNCQIYTDLNQKTLDLYDEEWIKLKS
ncbi:MAG: ABC transporter substrate-binding protein [Clostridium sp.]|uniref:ABC transporter substrate-binding protein n=1 Tax=Clostridium sp. TaxID=1506 RepID=UPI003F2CA921